MIPFIHLSHLICKTWTFKSPPPPPLCSMKAIMLTGFCISFLLTATAFISCVWYNENMLTFFLPHHFINVTGPECWYTAYPFLGSFCSFILRQFSCSDWGSLCSPLCVFLEILQVLGCCWNCPNTMCTLCRAKVQLCAYLWIVFAVLGVEYVDRISVSLST